MNRVGVNDLFNLIAFFVRKREPDISVGGPTFDDLEAEFQHIYSSEEPETETGEPETIATVPSEKATAVATGCVPCSIGHLGTCSGLLNEAMRFARNDGVQSEEVISRVNMCLDELNALERVDLRPEMIYGLPDWEKSLAEKALNLSRSLRHDLELLPSALILEGIAAKTQGTRQEIGKAWMMERLKRMTPEQRKLVEEQLKERAAEQKQEA